MNTSYCTISRLILPLLRPQLHLELLFLQQIIAWQNCTALLNSQRTIFHCFAVKTVNINDVQAMALLNAYFDRVKSHWK